MNLISSTLVKRSRKKHRCDYCGCEIEKGVQYYNDTIVFDGGIYNWKSHPECADIGSFMYQHGIYDDEGVSSDWFEDFVSRRLFEGGRYTKEDVHKMSYYEMAKIAYNDLKENKLKV